MGGQFNAINVRQNSKLREIRAAAAAHSAGAARTPHSGECDGSTSNLAGRRSTRGVGQRAGAAPRVMVGLLTLLAAPLFAGPATAPKPPNSPQFAVPVSILDLMRASVEIPADGIWAAQGAEKLSDDDWLLADEDSVSLAGAATLVSKPGTARTIASGWPTRTGKPGSAICSRPP